MQQNLLDWDVKTYISVAKLSGNLSGIVATGPKSLTQQQSNIPSTRPANTFPTQHRRPLASTKLYCLINIIYGGCIHHQNKQQMYMVTQLCK